MENENLIVIEGSHGEGGGQVLRTCLTMSLVTGKPFRIEQIRALRPRPGLLPQHLTAVRAAAEVGSAQVHGATPGAKTLTFLPGEIRSGEYHFSVGTAGSTTLVLQTVLPALLLADNPSTLILEGGTHNPWAPPFDFVQRVFLPLVNRMGPNVQALLERPGFYPAGGGKITVTIMPQKIWQPIELLERGAIHRCTAKAVVSRLPLSIAQREIKTIQQKLSWPAQALSAQTIDSVGPGNAVSIEIESEHITEVFTGFGRRGVPAETVAMEVIHESQRYLGTDAPVGQRLADQLLIPMILAGGGAFRTLPPSSHTITNLDIIRQFVNFELSMDEIAGETWQIKLSRR
ncbi:MAG TPA: RNA 3'-terminal phosphate cyclase [Thermoguttaceae bacterium]